MRPDRNSAATGYRRANKACSIHEQDGPCSVGAAAGSRGPLPELPENYRKCERDRGHLHKRRGERDGTAGSESHRGNRWFRLRITRMGIHPEAVCRHVGEENGR